MTKKKKEKLEWEQDIPDGTEIKVDGSRISVKKGAKSIERDFNTKKVKIEVKGKKLVIKSPRFTKVARRTAGSILAHVQNMCKGLAKAHVYKLKICSGHFPINVSVSGNEFVVKNFLGESAPRKIKLREGVKVKVEGTEVTVESERLELAGQTAADIEQLTKIKDRDLTRFQDGIYIIEKDGDEI
jgi:large subunit ribosomal protein L6